MIAKPQKPGSKGVSWPKEQGKLKKIHYEGCFSVKILRKRSKNNCQKRRFWAKNLRKLQKICQEWVVNGRKIPKTWNERLNGPRAILKPGVGRLWPVGRMMPTYAVELIRFFLSTKWKQN